MELLEYHCFVALTKANDKYSSKLSEGKSTRHFEEYTCRLDELGLGRMDHQIETDLALLETNLKDDLDFLCNGKYNMCLCEI